MRVLFVTNMWPDEARPWYGSFVRSQARSLESLGLEIEVLAIRGYTSAWEYARGTLRTLESNTRRYDIVHAHYGHSGVVARLNFRTPLVVSFCGDDLLGSPDPRRPTRRTRTSRVLAGGFAQLARVSSATITKSEQLERRLPLRCRPRNHVIPNGVDLARFAPADQLEARRELGWPPDEKVVLFVGDPDLPGKNYPLAEAACSLARNGCPDLELRVAWGISPAKMPIWMNAADVLVHPSFSEGSPNAVKEAMACELPVVSTPVGDVPERLRGLSGSFIRPPDPKGFAEALLEACRHGRSPEARAAAAQLGLDQIAERVTRVYESVACAG